MRTAKWLTIFTNQAALKFAIEVLRVDVIDPTENPHL